MNAHVSASIMRTYRRIRSLNHHHMYRAFSLKAGFFFGQSKLLLVVLSIHQYYRSPASARNAAIWHDESRARLDVNLPRRTSKRALHTVQRYQ